MSELTEIYISLNGEKRGPFDPGVIDRMLRDGIIRPSDQGWRPGLRSWTTIEEVLRAPAPVVTETEPVAFEPATPKQKAFLSYMGLPFTSDLSKEKAALLVNDAMENPRDPKRLARWPEDRVRMHPELFAGDAQARKENRPNHFHQLTLAQGSDFFRNVSKAHCQVLVGFLDVKHPNWDAREQEALHDFFFPALAEKFPQLVQRAYRGKIKYAEGPKVAKEMEELPQALADEAGETAGVAKEAEAPAARNAVKRRPVSGSFSWVPFGVFVTLALVIGIYIYKHPGPAAPGEAAKATPEAAAPAKVAVSEEKKPELGDPVVPQVPAPALAVNETPPPASLPEAAPAPAPAPAGEMAPPAPAPAGEMAAPGATAAPGEMAPATPGAPAPGMKTGDLFGAPVASDPGGMAPAPGMAANPPAPAPAPAADGSTPPGPVPAPLFAPPSAASTAAAAATPVPATAAARTTVKLTRAVDVQTAYGKVIIPVGTSVKILAKGAGQVTVTYMNTRVTVPASSTDLDAAP